jgi:hypothetical protein
MKLIMSWIDIYAIDKFQIRFYYFLYFDKVYHRLFDYI